MIAQVMGGHLLKQIEAVRHKLEDPAGSLSWVNQAPLLLRVVDTLFQHCAKTANVSIVVAF